MSKTVPFKKDKICDDCGAVGAYDFYGDYICAACMETLSLDAEEEIPDE